jgi:hypothetical protein
MTKETAQQRLFNRILSESETKGVAVKELCGLLKIAKSALYERLSGTKPLSVIELTVLMEHYQIPAHQLFSENPQHVLFDYVPLAYAAKKDEKPMERILSELQNLARDPIGQVQYMAPDIPLFYYFLYKELAYFKMYLYQHYKTTIPIHRLPKISFAAITKAEEKRFLKVAELYAHIPSEEIWTKKAFAVTLDEIQYFVKAGLFQYPKEALLLLDKVDELLEKMSLMASNKDKSMMTKSRKKGQSLTLFYNDFNKFNPTIITQKEGVQAVYVAYELPHYLKTENPAFISYSQDWFKRIKHKSIPVSENANVVQGQFFKVIKQRIKRDRRALEKRVGD